MLVSTDAAKYPRSVRLYYVIEVPFRLITQRVTLGMKEAASLGGQPLSITVTNARVANG